jgi:ubiquinone/menaquinone biosynthesis C-methylase UbiE
MRIERHDFSDLANRAELNYRENIQPHEAEFTSVDSWEARVRGDNRLAVLPWLQAHGVNPRGEGLDLGAGSCWLSAQLSTLPAVERVHALEFSDWMLTKIAPGVIERLGGDQAKITLHIGDIHRLSMFEDESLDFIAASAVLHHASDLHLVMRECRRVLRDDGLFFAILEPAIPKVITPFTRELSEQHFGEAERQHGVKDQTFHEREWREAYEQAGFDVRFMKMFVRTVTWRGWLVRYTPVRWTNGLFFWEKAMVARPKRLAVAAVGAQQAEPSSGRSLDPSPASTGTEGR